MQKTTIQWTDMTWNPLLGCRRVSRGCGDSKGGGCYAERLIAVRFSKNPKLPMYHGIAELTPKGEPRFTGEHRLLPDRLDEPLRARKGRRIFVCDMGDLFFEGHAFEEIAAVWGVMAAAHWHTFQVLTKRPERALEFFAWIESGSALTLDCLAFSMGGLWAHSADGRVETIHNAARQQGVSIGRFPPEKLPRWPLPNVHVGVSVEDQPAADERIPLLLQIPAALRFLSMEPLLGPVDLGVRSERCDHAVGYADACRWCRENAALLNGIDWVIVGGESGPLARPMDLAWARSIRDQCRAPQVPVFVKQLGARPLQPALSVDEMTDGRFVASNKAWPGGTSFGNPTGNPAFKWRVAALKDRHGGDMAEWPEDLRVREVPRVEGEDDDRSI